MMNLKKFMTVRVVIPVHSTVLEKKSRGKYQVLFPVACAEIVRYALEHTTFKQ